MDAELSEKQADLSKLVVELSTGNQTVLEGVNLNNYVEVEDQEILLSAFLLNHFLNPSEERGDDAIRMIMEKKPDLSLPVMSEGDLMSTKAYLDQFRQVFADNAAPDMSTEECASVVGRIDFILTVI